MAALYRKEILKEPVPEGGFVPLGNLVAPTRRVEENTEAVEPVLGD
jgi:hypothetical protein